MVKLKLISTFMNEMDEELFKSGIFVFYIILIRLKKNKLYLNELNGETEISQYWREILYIYL